MVDFNKNKYGIAILLIIVAAAIHYFFFYEPCKQPPELTVSLTQLNCIMKLTQRETFRDEICQHLNREKNCSLSEEDKPEIMKMIDEKVNECTREHLASENYCLDSIKEL